MLSAHGLAKRFGRCPALCGFDLEVAASEVVGLVGRNGAGKTTFVEVVAGLVRPDAGRVTVDGVDVSDRRHGGRLIGVSPQEQALYPSLTVSEHLRLFASLYGLGRRDRERAVDSVIGELDLGGVRDRRVGLLSGGQRRRAQAACALVGSPPLLLLDEPTVGSDPETRRFLLAAVSARAAAGAAIVYTTHYLAELYDLDATLAVVDGGRVVARGTQAALLARLPSRVRVVFGPASSGIGSGPTSAGPTSGGNAVEVSTFDPAAALVELLARGGNPTSVEIDKPTLESLYDELAVSRAA